MAEAYSDDLLRTKIYRPPLPADCVHRESLVQLMEEGRSRPLTLISAPAGYGKSVLVSDWMERTDWAAVWVSLDEEDSDLQRFLSYVTAAVCDEFPEALATTRSMARAAQFPGAAAVANTFNNELNAIDRPFFLVLDDYHRIHAASPVNELLRSLLDHPPIPLHIVLLTRRDPALPMGRLRGRGQVSELRMQDLRFSAADTQDLLEQIAHIRAGRDAVANVERELEGWAAGLRLLTLALRGTSNADDFLRGFRGGTQQMQEYLISEVMAGLPKPLSEWLLHSACLERFCAPLCDAVCAVEGEGADGSMDGEAFLHQLQAANLFLVPLDAYGRWFRYHSLFQKLLQDELARRADASEIAELQKRASRWFKENGFIEDAIRCALKAGDPEGAADILEAHRLQELEKLNWPVVDRWLQVLGPVASDRPGLLLAEAFVAVRRFDVSRQAAVLREAAPLIEGNPAYADLLGELRCLQGILNYRMGDGETSHRLLQEARERFEGTEKHGIAGFAVTHETLSLGLCGRGDEAIAQNEALEGAAATSDPIYHGLLLAGRVAFSYMRGDLGRCAGEAVQLYNVTKSKRAEFPFSLSLFFRVGSDLQRGDFGSALAFYDEVAQRRYTMPLRMAFSAMEGLALSGQLSHQPAVANRAVAAMMALAQEHNTADAIAHALSSKARIRLLQGDLDSAALWAGHKGTPPRFADLFLSVEVQALTRARVWIAQGSEDCLVRALALLEEVGRRAESWHATSQVIEADLLRSIALASLDREAEALELLAGLIARAAPGGWVRPFLEAARPVADLIVRLEAKGLASDHASTLLRSINAWLAERDARLGEVPVAQAGVRESLSESLTNREIDILGLLGNRLQNKEIARALSVSPETVKTHLKNLYAKLGVSNRREAVAKSTLVLSPCRPTSAIAR